MPLDFQLVQAPFRFGVDEGTDPKQVPFGTLLTAENVVWKKSGRVEKRQGTTVLTTSINGGGNISAAKRLIVRGDELALSNGVNLYSYVQGAWYDRGKLPELGFTWSTIQDSYLGARASDIAYLSDGRVVQAWATGDGLNSSSVGDIYYQILDLATGAVLQRPTRIATSASFRVRVIASGTTWAVFYVKDADFFHYNSSGGSTALAADVINSNPNKLRKQSFDVCTIGSNFVVAYAAAAGGITLKSYSFVATPVLQATGTVTSLASTGIWSISIDGATGETLYIAYGDQANALIGFAAANPSTLVQTVVPTTMVTAVGLSTQTVSLCRRDATSCLLCYSYAVSGANTFASVSVTNAGVKTDGRDMTYMRLLSRPFSVGSRFYAMVTTDTVAGTFLVDPGSISGTDTFIVDVTVESVDPDPHRLVGKTSLIVGGTWGTGYVTTPSVVSSTRTIVAAPFVSTAASTMIGWRQGVMMLDVLSGTSLPQDSWRSISIGQEAYFAAGVFSAYDSLEVIGYGWAHASYVDPTNTVAAGAGGTMATGTYIYSSVPERRSQVGVLHRGPTATPFSVAVTGPTGQVTVVVMPVSLNYSAYNAGVTAVYRTVVGGSTLQRLSVEPSFGLISNAAAPPYQVVDTEADASIWGLTGVDLSERPALYTEGGELDDYQPPSILTTWLYRERIFGITGDRREVWFSKSHAANPGTAPGFHPQLRLVFNDTLVAGAVLEERNIVFSETGIYHFSGDGPAPNGDGSDYGTPNKLQTDVGCTNPRGVVQGPEGVFFVSGSEIHMLDRGLNVVWIGKRMQDQLDAFPNITSAVLVPKKNHVRFSCNNNAGSAGIVLVFDYVENQWSTFIYAGGVPIADAVMHDEVYTFVTTSGVVYKESDATYLDNGAWVTAKIETAWIHAAGPLAYHSVRNFRLDGVSMTAHGLSISVGFNGNTTYQQGPESWAEGVSDVTTPGDSVTANISIGNRRKCRSIRFKVQDSAPVTLGTGQGAKWSSMGLEVGLKRGLGQLAARQKG